MILKWVFFLKFSSKTILILDFALGVRILELIISTQHFTTFFAEIAFFDKNCSEKNLAWNNIKKCSQMIQVMILQHACGGNLSYLKFNLYQLITATNGRGVT